ncbi:MAG: hypothetical protein KBD04_00270 [Proteobacteria bacterium]|jgi:predicted DNA-binding protein|nr:hypothetical protein [Pseudomonadota bacterium]
MQIDIPKDLEKFLLEVSKKLSIEPSNLVLSALEEYLEDQHDYYIGIQGYQRYLASGRKATSLEDMRKELELERD